jgi:two-component system nitrate/nitrite response regulator NarL
LDKAGGAEDKKANKIAFGRPAINQEMGSPLAGKTERANMLNTVQISLLGRNEIAREGLRKILSGENFQINISTSDPAVIMSKLPARSGGGDAHVVVIDNGDGAEVLDACKLLAAAKTDAKLVLLADRYAFDDVASAFQAGVDAVIIKEISCDPLIESIRLVAMGEKVFPSQLAADLSNCMPVAETGDWRSNAAEAGLSSREVEILETIMAGMANKVIARKFDICEATVKVHVKAILRKLGVENRTQAATWAVKHSVAAPAISTGPGAPPSVEINATTHYGSPYGQAA